MMPFKQINSATPSAKINLVGDMEVDNSGYTSPPSPCGQDKKVKKSALNDDVYEVNIEDVKYEWDTKIG